MFLSVWIRLGCSQIKDAFKLQWRGSESIIINDWLKKHNNQLLSGLSVRFIVWFWLTATTWWEGLSPFLTFYKPWFSLLQVLMHCTPNSSPSFLSVRPSTYLPSNPRKLPADSADLLLFILLETMRVFLLFLWSFPTPPVSSLSEISWSFQLPTLYSYQE